MLAGAPLCAVAFVLMFAPPEELGLLSATAWFAVTYTAYYAFHTMYQIPHYGLGAELTQDYAERSSVFGWAEGFAVAGTLVAATVPPLLIGATGGERSGYAAFAMIFGSLLTLLYFHLVWRVKERPDFANRPPNPLIPGVRRVMRNRPFRLLLAVYLIGAVTGAIPGLLMPYFTKYVLMPEDPNTWLAIYLATYFGAGFLCLPRPPADLCLPRGVLPEMDHQQPTRRRSKSEGPQQAHVEDRQQDERRAEARERGAGSTGQHPRPLREERPALLEGKRNRHEQRVDQGKGHRGQSQGPQQRLKGSTGVAMRSSEHPRSRAGREQHAAEIEHEPNRHGRTRTADRRSRHTGDTGQGRR